MKKISTFDQFLNESQSTISNYSPLFKRLGFKDSKTDLGTTYVIKGKYMSIALFFSYINEGDKNLRNVLAFVPGKDAPLSSSNSKYMVEMTTKVLSMQKKYSISPILQIDSKGGFAIILKSGINESQLQSDIKSLLETLAKACGLSTLKNSFTSAEKDISTDIKTLAYVTSKNTKEIKDLKSHLA